MASRPATDQRPLTRAVMPAIHLRPTSATGSGGCGSPKSQTPLPETRSRARIGSPVPATMGAAPGKGAQSELNIRSLPVVPQRDTTWPGDRPGANKNGGRESRLRAWEATTMTIRSSIRSILAPAAVKVAALAAGGAVIATVGLAAVSGASASASAPQSPRRRSRSRSSRHPRLSPRACRTRAGTSRSRQAR